MYTTQTGLLVSFFGVFTGVIDLLNLYRPITVASVDKKFSKGSVLLARIVFVDYGNKSIRLSLRPHVVEFRGLTNLVPLGEVISDLQIVQCHKKIGVLAANITESDENNDEDDDDDDDDDDNHASISKKSKGSVTAVKRQRIKDEKIVTAFVHKSSLIDKESRVINDIKKAHS